MSDTDGVKTIPGAAALPPKNGLAQRLRWPLMIGGPLIILGLVAWFVLTGGRYQSTDDAYVQAARVPVSASVAGRIVAVEVKENQHVEAGQVLFRLDDHDLRVALEQAEAQLANARLQVQTQQAAYGQQTAGLAAAEETVAYTTREMNRERELMNAGVASRQQYDMAVHAADQARAQVATLRQQSGAALVALGGSASTPVGRNPSVMQAQAMVDRARLNLSYTTIIAPQAGIVTKVEQVPVGTYVNVAQPLFYLVAGAPYVEANFKENQLAKMRVGQPVEIDIDAFKGQKLKGHVASFSPGTGQAFSVLPAQNATGNWVKVVQRLPVRIDFDQVPPDMASHAGLSAKVKVDTRAPVQTPAKGR